MDRGRVLEGGGHGWSGGDTAGVCSVLTDGSSKVKDKEGEDPSEQNHKNRFYNDEVSVFYEPQGFVGKIAGITWGQR